MFTIIAAMLGLGAFFVFARQARASVETQFARSAELNLAGLRGQVLDQATGQPISSAIIRAIELNLQITSDPAGNFAWPAIPLPQAQTPVTVSVIAAGYGEWRMQNVRLVAGDTVVLTPHLQDRPTNQALPPGRSFAAPGLSTDELRDFQAFIAATETMTIPATIRLRITGDWRCRITMPYTIEVVDFNFYIKHVLATEWHPDTPGQEMNEEAYRAGAMAIKTYAWFWINRGGKWDDADLYGSVCDQAYNPEYARQATDRAVDFTWDWRLTRGGKLFQAYHKRSDVFDCSPGACLSQIGSQDLAVRGYEWNEILLFYYNDAEVWYYEPEASPRPTCDPAASRSDPSACRQDLPPTQTPTPSPPNGQAVIASLPTSPAPTSTQPQPSSTAPLAAIQPPAPASTPPDDAWFALANGPLPIALGTTCSALSLLGCLAALLASRRAGKNGRH
jgi:hypothetical protein